MHHLRRGGGRDFVEEQIENWIQISGLPRFSGGRVQPGCGQCLQGRRRARLPTGGHLDNSDDDDDAADDDDDGDDDKDDDGEYDDDEDDNWDFEEETMNRLWKSSAAPPSRIPARLWRSRL